MIAVWAGLAGALLCGGFVLAGMVLAGQVRDSAGVPRRPARRTARAGAGRVSADSLRRVAGAVAAAAAAWVATGWPVAAVGAGLAVTWLPWLFSRHRGEQVIDRMDALATWTRRLADLLASGAGGLDYAIAASAATAPPSLRSEITALASRAQVRGLEPALRAFAARLADPAADRLVASLILRVRAGGRGLVDVLDGLARSLREEIAARRHAEADRAKPRANMRSLVIITLVVAGGLAAFARPYLAPLDTPAGQLVLATTLAIFAGGFVWMHRLTTPRQSGLFLAGPKPPDPPVDPMTGTGAVR
jgi:hypothetical protein